MRSQAAPLPTWSYSELVVRGKRVPRGRRHTVPVGVVVFLPSPGAGVKAKVRLAFLAQPPLGLLRVSLGKHYQEYLSQHARLATVANLGLISPEGYEQAMARAPLFSATPPAEVEVGPFNPHSLQRLLRQIERGEQR